MQEGSEIQVDPQLCAELRRLGVECRQSVPASRFTTLGVGGQFEYFLEVDKLASLKHVLPLLSESSLSVRPLGFGSNLLISDSGVRGWTLKLGAGFRYLEPKGTSEFEVGSSMGLMSLSRVLSNDGFSGLEFAGGIPASFGGAVKMNAGAHGGEIAERLTKVTVITGEGKELSLTPRELNFSYRHSAIEDDWFVVSACLKLTPGDKQSVSRLMRENLASRKRTQPLQLPSAGSVFKNPSVSQPAGKLIEECGLKGSWEGDAQVSDLHGNWIVNPNRSASSAQVTTLIQRCKELVRNRFDVELETEVISWGAGQAGGEG